MKLNFNKDYMESLIKNYELKLKDHFTSQGFIDSKQKFGTEHYKLFMAISMQLKNVSILEIGTHNGNSAIALSYGNFAGNNIKIDTYDIIDLLQECSRNFFNKSNINYKLENLFDINVRETNKDKILSYDIIFIDIDPHEGILEYEMLNWLKDNKYEGLIIFDDIHLGLGHTANNYRTTEHSMNDFWGKINDEIKKDLTYIGHHSGTGMVCFNFDKHEITY
jgi:predicted O-methyltransferase YrrM